MVLGYQVSLDTIRNEPEYQREIQRNLPNFPPIDCPEEYKEALSGLCRGQSIDQFLDFKVPALGKKSARELLLAKDYEKIEYLIAKLVQIDVMGTGAL